jgi:hypothetical protein
VLLTKRNPSTRGLDNEWPNNRNELVQQGGQLIARHHF